MKRVRREDEEEEVQAEEPVDVSELDDVAVKRMILQLEKSATKNMELRALHPKDPTKWIDSEVALDEAISALSALSSNPRLYVGLVQQKTHETLVGLLAHDNTDVSVAVLNLLTELLDDAPEEDEELMVQALGGELAEAGAVAAALLNWRRLQEGGEGGGAGVEATAAFLDRMIVRDPETAESLAAADGFLAATARTFDARAGASEEAALAVSELLSAAVMGGAAALVRIEERARSPAEEAARQAVLETLLGAVNERGRAKSPSLAAAETLSNVAAAVASLVQLPGWSGAFAALQGARLCVKLLEKQGCGVVAALRLLAYATQDRAEACEDLVEAGGLVPLFWWWRQDAWPKKLAKRFGWGPDEWQTLRESLVSILYNCCQMLGHESMAQLRLWKKFSDDGGEGVQRCAQLWSEYKTGLARKGLMVERPEAEDEQNAQEEEEEEEEVDELLIKRLDNGWLSLTQLSLILVWLACVPSPLLPTLQASVQAASAKHNVRWPNVAAVLQQHKKRSGYQITVPKLEKIFQN